MKNYFLILAALCCVLFIGCKKEDVGIDTKIPSDPTEAFPDPLFRAYVLENFDTDGDGIISEEEALTVTEIDVYNYDNRNDESKWIKSLKGIQYFTNLTYLDCRYHKIASLDVSKNTALTDLRCSSNLLTTLDVSKNTALTILWCSANQLTTLDVSKNTALTDLRCNYNQLTTLDVSKNTALTILSCNNNNLTTLDVSKNTALTTLVCCNNQLTTLDLSKNTALTELRCYSNQIEELDLSKTNLVNSSYNKDSSSVYPLDCAPMETLKKVYLKKGWSIERVTEDWNRSSSHIPDHTEIIFVD